MNFDFSYLDIAFKNGSVITVKMLVLQISGDITRFTGFNICCGSVYCEICRV